MNATQMSDRSRIGSWVTVGALMGLLAGAVFILFEMVAAKLIGQPPGPAGPLQLIAAIVLGREALPPGAQVGIGTALTAGFIVHFSLSAIFGAIFGAIVAFVGALRTNYWLLVGAATFYGLVLWIVNFYVAGNILFPWFTQTNPFLQFVAHGFFFGAVLGLLLEGARRKGER